MTQSIVDQIESAFAGLGNRSAFRINPSSLHPTLPNRRIGIGELRSVLMHSSVTYAIQDAVLIEFVRRSHQGERDWVTVVLGMLLPGIRPIVNKFTRNARSRDRGDIEAEIVTGLIAAIGTFDLDNTRSVASRIVWAGFRAGLASRIRNNNSWVSLTHDVADIPDGHPDFVLTEAVESGVITADEAWLIAETRIGDVRLPDWAEIQCVSQDTMRHRRAKAERQIRAWISGVGE